MTNEQIYDAAYAEAATSYGRTGFYPDRIRAAAGSPLAEGDRVYLGGGTGNQMHATVTGGRLVITHRGQETGNMALDEVPAKMLDRVLVLRAKQAGQGTI